MKDFIRLMALVGITKFASVAALAQDNSARLAELLPQDAGDMVVYGPGNWLPNSNGFHGELNPSLSVPLFMALTATGIYLEQWDVSTNKFSVVKTIRYSEIASAEVDHFGFNARLALKLEDGSYDSFDFTKVGGGFVDRTKTNEAGAYIIKSLKPLAKSD